MAQVKETYHLVSDNGDTSLKITKDGFADIQLTYVDNNKHTQTVLAIPNEFVY